MNKENLVLLTGTLCTEACFAHQKQSLANIANITVDTLQSSDSSGHSVQEMATEILKRSPKHFSLVGFSMGGVIALEIQRQAPERVLMNVNPAGTTISQQETWQSWNEDIDAGRFSKVVKVFKDSIVQKDCNQTVWSMAHHQGEANLKRQLQTLSTRKDSRPYLADITCPTLLLCGRDDRITPVSVHYEMHEAIPNSSFMSIAECGHYSPLEQPQMVNTILRHWLTDIG